MVVKTKPMSAALQVVDKYIYSKTTRDLMIPHNEIVENIHGPTSFGSGARWVAMGFSPHFLICHATPRHDNRTMLVL